MSNCTGGAQLPNPVFNLSCDITCTNGYFLPIGSSQCSECEQGTFSHGGALNVYTWDKWPNFNYKTYCTDINGVILNDLPGWVLNGTWVDSGVYLDDNQNSILEFEATWVRDGIIKFNWRVSGEPSYDGLIFYIDNMIKIPLTSTHLSGFSSFNLTEGTHKFKFVYSKDYSVSVGDDRAFIYELVLEGVDYADSMCTPCAPGKFSNHTATQECSICPFGTYNNGTGATSCLTCPPLTYSFEGANECTPMLPCVDTDYEMKTTECRAGTVFDHIYSWRTPKICDDSQFHLPPNIYNTTCYDCQPGQFRSSGDYVCRSCPPGTYLQGENTCVNCGEGSYAPRLSTYSRWDTWPSGWNFSCDGDLCANPSWRLNGISVDSGFGHGAYSSPFLSIPINIEGEDSKISISFRFTCTGYCYVGFYTNKDYLGYFLSSSDTNLATKTYDLTPGTTSFGVSFYRYTSDNFGTDRLIIRNISIYGDSNGGAIECLQCKDGTSSPALSPFCSNCPAGSYSVNGSACAQCPANTFSANNGSTTCTPCGHGTFSDMGSTECSTDCTFAPYSNLRLGNDSMIKYNLTALMKNKMWGPVVDSLNYKYFFSICSKDHDNTSCIDQDGRNIRSFACQAVNAYYSVDLGNLLAFHLRPNAPSDMGLVMSISGGDNAGCSRKRELNITFICDPTKGDGQPRPPSTGVIEVGTTCQYNVIWESLYACPVCSERDYSFDIGICYNGFANKTYRWVESPNVKNCHDGVSLPPTEVVACGNLLCNPGQWQPPGSDRCVDVDPGYFSVGGASYYYDWTSLPYEYTLACSSSQCSDWRLQDSVIASGNGDSSLFLELTYLRAGTISFTYRTNAEGASSFSFSVDNNQVFNVNSTQIVYTTKTVNVSPGKHVFRWKFSGGVTSSNVTRAVFAKIKTIVAVGTKTSSGSQLPCLAGTFSSGGTSACSICPANKFSPAVSSECTDCLPDTYSIPQSSHCMDKPLCTTSDYQQFYTPCDAETKNRTSYYLLNQPVICKMPSLPQNTSVECSQEDMVCALGQLSTLSSDHKTLDCQPCPLGTFANNESFICEGVPAGSFATSVYVAFPDNVLATHPNLPDGFSTGCEGICGSNGWRVITGSSSGSFRQAVDSGYHDDNEVDSFLKYTGTFVEDGSINFAYKVTGDDNVGLEFFIDGVMQTNVWRSTMKRDLEEVTYPIKKGSHTFMWLYHQSPNNTGSAMLGDIVMMGVEGGSISTPCPPGSISKLPFQPNCALCSPGTYNADYGQTLCKMCSIGEFSWQYGATECLSCANGKNQQPGMSSCTTDCAYTDPSSKQVFNISTLSTTFGPVSDFLSNKQYYINPCLTNQGNKCVDANGNKISTYVCEVDPKTGYGLSAGQNVAYTTSVDPVTHQPYLTVSYSNGDSTGCEGNESRSTNIIFVCDTTTANQISFSGTLGCRRAITWRSRLACRVCSTSTNPLLNPDYDVLYGECQPDNKKGAIMYRNATCNGPAVITTARAECTYEAKKGSVPVGAIIIVIVGVSGLLGVIVVVAVKNRRLNHQYTNLLTQSINLDTDTEMGKVGSHDLNVKTDEEENI